MSVPANQPDTQGAYHGLRVLDFSMYVAGPYCTRLMADMGAEVIKVEPPTGDFLRAAPPVREGQSAYFGQMNCGKRSLAVDLKREGAVAIIERLFERADVVVENFRPGVMARLGLDYPAARAVNPDIIYCSVSGYGQTGPKADRPSFAPIIHAASGFDMLLPRYNDTLPGPVANRYVVADCLAAVHALAGIGAALYRRSQTGEGEFLDVALMDTMHNVMAYEYADSQFDSGQGPIVFRPMPTRDGFVAIAPVSEANFRALAAAAGQPGWMNDERFASRAARVENWEPLLDTIEQWTRTLTSAEAEAALLEQGCPASAYRTIDEARRDQQVQHREASAEVHDAAGSYRVANCPIQFTNATARARPDVPGLGQDADAILNEAGFDAESLRTYRDAGVIPTT